MPHHESYLEKLGWLQCCRRGEKGREERRKGGKGERERRKRGEKGEEREAGQHPL